VRPERIRLGAGGADDNTVQAIVGDIVPLGARTHVYAQAAGGPVEGDRLLCELPGTADASGARAGDDVLLHWPVADTLVYPAAA
jgi:hypothetical protein